MPYQVTKMDGDTESIGKTRVEMAKDLKALEPGRKVLGYIGDSPPSANEAVESPNYSTKELDELVGIQNILKKFITPPVLGAKFTDKQSQIRFIRKVEKQTLAELRRFWDKPIPEDGEISLEDAADLNGRWDELSP